MSLTVKATYRGETRKLTFNVERNTFPSFDQLYRQLYKVFPISHSIILSKLLFSPDSSKSRLLVSREVRTAEEYSDAIAPFTGKAWSNPLLRFSVADETPHKLPAIAHASQPTYVSPPVASNPQKPVVSDAYPTVEPLFGRISYSHIPPPPIIFSSRPSPQEPMDCGPSFDPRMNDGSPIAQPEQTKTPQGAQCCAVAQTKQDILDLITGFKIHLDRVVATLEAHPDTSDKVKAPTPPMVPPSVGSTLSLPPAPIFPPLCQFNYCYRCGVIKQGPWFNCGKCSTNMCVTCYDTATTGDCYVGTGPHVWNNQRCMYCVDNSPAASVPPLRSVTSWGSFPLNSFGSPVLPSVPTMPPVARDEPGLPIPPPPSLSFVTPAMPSVAREEPGLHVPPPPPLPVVVPSAEPIVSQSTRDNDGRIVHHGVVCDACAFTIVGIRHKCLDCPDYDLCTSCINGGFAERHNPFHEFFEISEPGRVVVHNVFSGSGERETNRPVPTHQSEAPAPRSSPVVHSATCNLCESRIRGDRYKCLDCPDFDTCANCFTITDEHHPSHGFVKVSKPDDFIRSQKNLQGHLATCDGCSKQIFGPRYKCMHQDCPDFDLCQDCEALPIPVHPFTHPLLKIRSSETAIPTVSRYARALDLSGSPVNSTRAPSPVSPYESGHMRNPRARVDSISSTVPPPSQFYFTSESSRSQTPEYEVNQNPSPLFVPPPFPLREPSPVYMSPSTMIPGTLPPFFTLPPLESLSLSPILKTPPIGPNSLDSLTLPPIRRTPPIEVAKPETEIPAPSPLWKHMPYTRRHSQLVIPGEYYTEEQDTAARTPSPGPICNYPVMTPVGSEHNHSPSPPSPDWRQVYSPGSPFPVRLPSQSTSAVPRVASPSHILPPVQSSTASAGFWPENFQEIRHLMEDEPSPSFTRDFSRWHSTGAHSSINESPLISEGEPLLTRPDSSDSITDSARSVRSLASILSSVHISVTNPFNTAMEAEQAVGTPSAPVPPIVSLPSSPEPLNAEFVADRSIPDGQVVAPGAEFLKAWVMRNGGNRAWPEDTTLVFVAGEQLAKDARSMEPKLVGSVQPGEQVDLWTEELKAPDVPGRYVGYYRLRDGEGNLFGHSIWLDVSVEFFHSSSPEASASPDEYMSSSSVIVMPQGAPTRSRAVTENEGSTIEQSLLPSQPSSPITGPSTQLIGDDLDVSDTESVSESNSSESLMSVPDSDSDDELWQDSRTSIFVDGAESQATIRATRQQSDEFVVLYETGSSEEE